MSSTKYEKLIRDKIPEIIEKSGKKAVVDVLDAQTFIKYLDDKLTEELTEYLTSGDVEELVDLVEVIYAILKHKNVNIEDFESIRRKKSAERGAFNKRLKLIEVIDNN